MLSPGSRPPVTVCRLLLAAAACLLSPATAARIDAVDFKLPPPPALTGPLATNHILGDAERLLDTKIAATHSFVSVGGHLYAVTAEGLVIDIAHCPTDIIADLKPKTCTGVLTSRECGPLVSIRHNPRTHKLLVLDASRGLFQVDPATRKFQQLWNAEQPVGGQRSRLLTDFVITSDGDVIMADASQRFDYDQEFWIRFEGKADGRLLRYNATSRAVTVLASRLAYPAGLEISTDGRSLLVAENSRARISRFSLVPTFVAESVWSLNLPGMPEHVRQSGRGGYWVGLTFPRHSGDVSVLDQYSSNRRARNLLVNNGRQTIEQLKAMFTARGLAVELDADGKAVRSLHDTTGLSVPGVIEVREVGAVAYIGTRGQEAVVRAVLPAASGAKNTAQSYLQVLKSRCEMGQALKFQQRMKAMKTRPTSPPRQQTRVMSIAPQRSPARQTVRFALLPSQVPQSVNPGYKRGQAAYHVKAVNTLNSRHVRQVHPSQQHYAYQTPVAPPQHYQQPAYVQAQPPPQVHYVQQAYPAPPPNYQAVGYHQPMRQSPMHQQHMYNQQSAQPMYGSKPPYIPPLSSFQQPPHHGHHPPHGHHHDRGHDPRHEQNNEVRTGNFPFGIDPFSEGPPVELPSTPQLAYSDKLVIDKLKPKAGEAIIEAKTTASPHGQHKPTGYEAVQTNTVDDILQLQALYQNTKASEKQTQSQQHEPQPMQTNNNNFHQNHHIPNSGYQSQPNPTYQTHLNPTYQNNQNTVYQNNQNPAYQSNQNPTYKINQNQNYQNNQNPTYSNQNSNYQNTQTSTYHNIQIQNNQNNPTLTKPSPPKPTYQNNGQHSYRQSENLPNPAPNPNEQHIALQTNSQTPRYSMPNTAPRSYTQNSAQRSMQNTAQVSQMQNSAARNPMHQSSPMQNTAVISPIQNNAYRPPLQNPAPRPPMQNTAQKPMYNQASINTPNQHSQNSFVPNNQQPLKKQMPHVAYQKPKTSAKQSFSLKKLKYNLSKIKDVIQTLPKSAIEAMKQSTPSISTEPPSKGGFFGFIKTTPTPTKEPEPEPTKCDSYFSCSGSPDNIPLSVDSGMTWGANVSPSSADNPYFGGVVDETPVTPSSSTVTQYSQSPGEEQQLTTVRQPQSSTAQQPQSPTVQQSQNIQPSKSSKPQNLQQHLQLPQSSQVLPTVQQQLQLQSTQQSQTSQVQQSQQSQQPQTQQQLLAHIQRQTPKVHRPQIQQTQQQSQSPGTSQMQRESQFQVKYPQSSTTQSLQQFADQSASVTPSSKISESITGSSQAFVSQPTLKPTHNFGVQPSTTQTVKVLSQELKKPPNPVKQLPLKGAIRQSSISLRLQEIFRRRLMNNRPAKTQAQVSATTNPPKTIGKISSGFSHFSDKNTGNSRTNSGHIMQTNILNQAFAKDDISIRNSFKQAPLNSAAARIHPNQAQSNAIIRNQPKSMFHTLTSQTGSPSTEQQNRNIQVQEEITTAPPQPNQDQSQSYVQLYKDNGQSVRIPLNHPGLIQLLRGGLTPQVAASIILKQQERLQQAQLPGQNNTPQNSFVTNWQASTLDKYTPPPFTG